MGKESRTQKQENTGPPEVQQGRVKWRKQPGAGQMDTFSLTGR